MNNMNNMTTKMTSIDDDAMSLMDRVQQLPVMYTICEGAVAVIASAGNLLVIVAFLQDKRLRRVTNFYIMSLACADLLVGLVGVPSAILTRMGIPHNAFNTCLTMLSLLIVFCTISILNLVAVSVDRFWAILFPLNYHSKMSSQAACGIIFSCWIIGALIGFLPLFGINNGPVESNHCLFIPIMSYNFLVFLYFATIVGPALLMAAFYTRIYMVVIGQIRTVSTISTAGGKKDSGNGLRRSRTFPIPLLAPTDSQRQKRREKREQRDRARRTANNYRLGQQPSIDDDADQNQATPTFETASSSSCSENNSRAESLRKKRKSNQQLDFDDVKPIRFTAYSRREVKKAQKLSIIVLFFVVCWLPLYTHNAVQAFWAVDVPAWILDAFIILSHVNSAVNPLLYAYHMKDFRAAFRRLLCECILRPQELRDRRRRELATLSALTNARVNYLRKANNRELNTFSASYPNSLLASPDHSMFASSSPSSRVPTTSTNHRPLTVATVQPRFIA